LGLDAVLSAQHVAKGAKGKMGSKKEEAGADSEATRFTNPLAMPDEGTTYDAELGPDKPPIAMPDKNADSDAELSANASQVTNRAANENFDNE
jgi:hypothetical protein